MFSFIFIFVFVILNSKSSKTLIRFIVIILGRASLIEESK